jgi:hypothetical protein
VRVLLLLGCLAGCNFSVDGLTPGAPGADRDSDGNVLFDLAVIASSGGDLAMAAGNDFAHTGAFIDVHGEPTPSAVDLTRLGSSDWAHWGFSSATDLDQKATGNTQITLFRPNPYPYTFVQYGTNPTAYFWQDGFNGSGRHPKAMGNGTPTGINVPGGFFDIEAPADTTVRVLRVYVGAFKAAGQISVSLDREPELPPYKDQQFSDDGSGSGSDWVYTITYAASTPGQKVLVQWSAVGAYVGGNVTLQSAALEVP